ncbi:RagB/SusD family nutrient uptake outer membrane protein [Niabella pedocola]|uniref:RagB/SusD family nutrient uptake outer membrane protein n=1 Tax=Niabella pedocola TaxID=1752077 RepID=A0ABS8PW81_9BACT|nr:RagB/SusD family nutrient uptake outer membrane protein [Niabella pedocola]MCD2425074.1 RagB/SusD family nutrient uptake outer membrane protein [Niabella pedocola]
MKLISKRFIWMALTAGSLLALSSCKKALEVKAYSYFTSDNFFSNADEAYMATLGVYGAVSNFSGYGWYVPMVLDNDNDISQISGNSVDSWRVIPHYQGIPETDIYYSTWSVLYQGIDRANVVIEKIPQMALFTSGTDDQKAQLNRMLGEAKFLRGFYYSELVRLWGDVPFKTASSKAGDNLKGTLTDRYVIYTQAIKDMQEAADVLPAAAPTDERINKWGAKAMLARVCLFAGGYALANDGTMKRPANYKDYYKMAQTQINEIMTANPYKLNPSYPQVFINQCKHNLEPTESIFQIALYTVADPAGDQPNSSRFGFWNAPQTAKGIYGSTNLRQATVRPFYESFQSGDVRKDFAVARFTVAADGSRTYPTTSTADQNWAPGKWSREYQTNSITEQTSTDINCVVMRYSDLLLMRAEVENELNEGPNDLALDAINQVRRRAYGLDMPGNAVTLTITDGGTGYTANPTLQITGGGGNYAAAVVATRTGNKITALTLSNPGYGYTSAPTVTVTGGNGTGAVITASLVPKPTTAQVYIPGGLAKQQFLDTLVSERAKELCFEGMRRSDLIRWNLLGAKIADTYARTQAIRTTYPYPAYTNFKTGKHELFPYPQNERDVNSSITRQNPGW